MPRLISRQLQPALTARTAGVTQSQRHFYQISDIYIPSFPVFVRFSFSFSGLHKRRWIPIQASQQLQEVIWFLHFWFPLFLPNMMIVQLTHHLSPEISWWETNGHLKQLRNRPFFDSSTQTSKLKCTYFHCRFSLTYRSACATTHFPF